MTDANANADAICTAYLRNATKRLTEQQKTNNNMPRETKNSPVKNTRTSYGYNQYAYLNADKSVNVRLCNLKVSITKSGRFDLVAKTHDGKTVYLNSAGYLTIKEEAAQPQQEFYEQAQYEFQTAYHIENAIEDFTQLTIDEDF